MPGPTDSSVPSPTPATSCPTLIQVDEVTTRQRLMDKLVDVLIQKTVAAEYWPEAYQRAIDVLEALPLATSEFAIVTRRLENARRYGASGEFGAAAFELRQLRGTLSA